MRLDLPTYPKIWRHIWMLPYLLPDNEAWPIPERWTHRGKNVEGTDLASSPRTSWRLASILEKLHVSLNNFTIFDRKYLVMRSKQQFFGLSILEEQIEIQNCSHWIFIGQVNMTIENITKPNFSDYIFVKKNMKLNRL